MNPSYTVGQAYRDLLDRAEVYFKNRIADLEREHKELPDGMYSWLIDLERVRIQELCNRLTARRSKNASK